MKKLLNLGLMLLVLFNSFSTEIFSQEMSDSTLNESLGKMSIEDSIKMLMEKSDDQRTGAIVLTGISIATAGVALFKAFDVEAYLNNEVNPGMVIGLTVGCLASSIGARTLFRASRRNRINAESLQHSSQRPASSLKKDQGQTVLIARTPFYKSSSQLLQKTSIGISSDKLDMGYYSRQAKINSLVISISLGK